MNPSGQLSSCSLSALRNSGESAVSTSSPGPVKRTVCSWVVRLSHARLERLLDVHQPLVRGVGLGVRLLLRQHSSLDQRAGVQLAHRGQALDPLVHLRLRVGGLVAFVVPVAPVADQVDQHVLVEAVPVRHGEPHRREAGLGVVGVDVDDRDVEALGQIGGVAGGARVLHVGGEADLVVGDEVERPAGPVPLERPEVERLGHDALARESRVAMNGDRQRRGGIVVRFASPALGLLRPRAAVHHGRDELQMTRVGRQAHGDGLALRGDVGAFGAVVVLHVAGAALRRELPALDQPAALELGEDRLVGPAHRVGQHVEPAAMGHADHHVPRARSRRRARW